MTARDDIKVLLASSTRPLSIPLLAERLGVSDARVRLLVPELVEDEDSPVEQKTFGRPATFGTQLVRPASVGLSRDGHHETTVRLGRQHVRVDVGVAELLVEIDKVFGDGPTPVTVMSCEQGPDSRPWILFGSLGVLEAFVEVCAAHSVTAARSIANRHQPETTWQIEVWAMERSGIVCKLVLVGQDDIDEATQTLRRYGTEGT